MRAANSIAEIPRQISSQENVGTLIITFVIGLSVVFAMWFNVSTPTAPRPTYPYYDTQKPVPPWSEPTPLEGNR